MQKLQRCLDREGLHAHDKMLVDIMLEKSEATIKAFVDVLRECGQGQLADMITDTAGKEEASNFKKSEAGKMCCFNIYLYKYISL